MMHIVLTMLLGDTPATPRKRKGTSSDSDEIRSKKPRKKATPKTAKKNSSPLLDDEELPHDAEKFIKAEHEWEDKFEFA